MKEAETSPSESVVKPIQVPKDFRGRIRWTILSQDPERLEWFIEAMAQTLLEEGVQLTGDGLREFGQGGLKSAIHRFYPGGFVELKIKLGISKRNDPAESQSVESLNKRRPKGYWLNPEHIRSELQEAITVLGHFPLPRDLKEMGLTTLPSALRVTGGVNYWRSSLGSEVIRKESGYWQDEENIKKELMDLIRNNLSTFPTHEILRKGNLFSLSDAIVRTGGMTRWREEVKDMLNVGNSRRRPSYWKDPKNILDEARMILEREGELNSNSIREQLPALLKAIHVNYPGMMRQLRVDLGIEIKKKPNGYWTPDQIEGESLEFYNEFGLLSQSELVRRGRKDLVGAIFNHYPGKLTALKDKLGIKSLQKPEAGPLVCSSQANTQLGKLLEATKLKL